MSEPTTDELIEEVRGNYELPEDACEAGEDGARGLELMFMMAGRLEAQQDLLREVEKRIAYSSKCFKTYDEATDKQLIDFHAGWSMMDEALDYICKYFDKEVGVRDTPEKLKYIEEEFNKLITPELKDKMLRKFGLRIESLQSQLTAKDSEIERLKGVDHKAEEWIKDYKVLKLKYDSHQKALKAVRDQVQDMRIGKHVCSEADYPGRCSECAHNKDVDSVLTLIDKELGGA